MSTKTQKTQKTAAATIINETEKAVGIDLLNNLADTLTAVDASSISFFLWAKAIYTKGGSKNSEASFAEVEKLIDETLNDVHVKSIVNRVKKINGVVYEVYKLGMKFDTNIVTFGNIEFAAKFVTSRTKSVTNGDLLFRKTKDGLKPTTLKAAKSAMTAAVSKAYKETLAAAKVKSLNDSHHRSYNNLLTDLMAEVAKKYTTEKSENDKFDKITKTLEEFLSECTEEHRLALLAKFTPPAVNSETEKELEDKLAS